MKKGLLILICCPLISWAQASFKIAESPFVQTRYTAALVEPMVQTGHFKFIAPDSIEWRYDGNQAMTLPPQMLQLIRQTARGDTMMLKSVFNIERQDKTLVLTPTKKQLQRLFSKMTIHYTTKGVAKQVEMLEPRGDKTIIEFTNMQTK